MNKSEQPERFRFVDWAFPVVGLLFAIFLAWAVGWLQASEAYKRELIPNVYTVAAKKDAEYTCIGDDAAAVFECVNQKVEVAHQTAHDEQDLTAQQRAASSALASAVTSFLALVLSAVGVWFVKRTLDATLIAVEDTGKATRAMEKQNDLAEASQRPWVSCEIVELYPLKGRDTSFHFRAKVRVKNTGNSPAFLARAYARQERMDSNNVIDFNDFITSSVKNMALNWFALAPGQEATKTIDEYIYPPLFYEDGNGPEGALACNYLVGIVYQDKLARRNFFTIDRIMTSKIVHQGDDLEDNQECGYYHLATFMA